MCTTCGCNDPKNKFTTYGLNLRPDTSATHSHDEAGTHHHHHGTHDHSHDDHHHHGHHHHSDLSVPAPHKINLETDILSQNNLLAQRNRGYFEAKNILSLNMMSAPGSGKTSLLEKTITDLKDEISFYIIEGDQQTTNDAERIASTGASVVQINTGNGCHLDASMINHAIKQLKVTEHSVVVIENVGNLVCPSLFDLGESKRVVIISVTEGEDKPLKYPTIFQSADICIINKIDLLPYIDIKTEIIKQNALRINPNMEIIEISVKTGEGINSWFQWLKKTKNALSEEI